MRSYVIIGKNTIKKLETMMIPVTKSFMPPIEDYIKYLEKIWESNQLTNHGQVVKELEQKLKEYLGVEHLFFVSNGTIALQIAIKALDLQGEIITTPFSYVATTSSIVWEGCKPVFVDIDPKTLCIDPDLIEKAITPQTTAILATHVYGIPCDVEKIKIIAQRNNLKVIYDAAHTFGVKYKDKSLVSYGDISTLSFHATKIFHTVEGGAIIAQDDDLAHRISYMRNFGHKGQEEFWGLGINGKNSEFHAAMGLCNLTKIDQIIQNRKRIVEEYNVFFENFNIKRPQLPATTEYNYAYYPIIFESEEVLIRVKNKLNQADIFPRRYFFPSLSELPYIFEQRQEISEAISKKVLCLPLFVGMTVNEINLVKETIQVTLQNV